MINYISVYRKNNLFGGLDLIHFVKIPKKYSGKSKRANKYRCKMLDILYFKYNEDERIIMESVKGEWYRRWLQS